MACIGDEINLFHGTMAIKYDGLRENITPASDGWHAVICILLDAALMHKYYGASRLS